MSTSLAQNGTSGFRLRRPFSNGHGYTRALDPTVAHLLGELNTLLAKRCFTRGSQREAADGLAETVEGPGEELGTAERAEATAAPGPKPGQAPKAKGAGGGAKAGGPAGGGEQNGAEAAAAAARGLDVRDLVVLPLTPRRIGDRSGEALRSAHVAPPAGTWEWNSLAGRLAAAQSDDRLRTLSDIIDADPKLSDLRYALELGIAEGWAPPESAAEAILREANGAIKDYLVAHAYFERGVREVNGLRNVVLNKPLGAPRIADYAATSAARVVIDEEKLTVPGIDQDNGAILRRIAEADVPLFAGAFRSALDTLVDDFVFNASYAGIIDGAKIGEIPAGVRPQLIEYIKNSPVKITSANANYYLPLFISQITGGVDLPSSSTAPDTDRDFEVDFFTVDDERAKISASAVRCAAQLYYSMVLGDELQVFGVVDYFTHTYLLRGGFEIEDPRLREDLQTYVFSQRFTAVDPRTNLKQVLDRTRPAERSMFYRQVFNQGTEAVADAMVLNGDFGRLWKILMLESATYLQRAQVSPNPESFVSRQNVIQAVEDLQYNVSVHCTGMAAVITPLIYKELSFVTRRILMHPEVTRQIAPAGGSWWKVVEQLSTAMNGVRPRATVLNHKAQLGHDILRAIADYDPATFDSDAVFSGFISKVDAFITTQSILQEALTDDLTRPEPAAEDTDPGDASTPRPAPMTPPPPFASAPIPGGSGTGDEWDF